MTEVTSISSRTKKEILTTSIWLISSYRKLVPIKEINTVTRLMKVGYRSSDKNNDLDVVRTLRTAKLLSENIAYDRNMLIATLLYDLCSNGKVSIDDVKQKFGDDVTYLINRLIKVSQLYNKQVAVKDENFQKLLLTFAEDTSRSR